MSGKIDPRLTPQRMEAMHLIMSGDMSIATSMFAIHQHELCDEILKWLIKKGITGPRFVEYVTKKHKRSTLSLISYVVAKLRKQGYTRPVFRRDFVN